MPECDRARSILISGHWGSHCPRVSRHRLCPDDDCPYLSRHDNQSRPSMEEGKVCWRKKVESMERRLRRTMFPAVTTKGPE